MFERLLICAAFFAAACSPDPIAPTPPTPAPPGVTFTWPKDGQRDVVTGTRIVVHLSDSPTPSAIGACSATDAGVVTGNFCLLGENGLVAATPQILANTIVLDVDGGLAADATYKLYARPALLPDAGNLPESAPLITFHTRADRSIAQAALTVSQVNDDLPSAFQDGGTGPTLPLLAPASIRVLFSAPLDLSSVDSTSVQLFRVDPSGSTSVVAGTLLAKGARVTFDPDDDLDSSKSYRLHLGAIRDTAGDALQPIDLELHPVSTGPTYPQDLSFSPPVTTGTTPQLSDLSGLPINTNTLSSPLIGKNTLGLTGGGLQLSLADPSAFGGPIPMILRKGQQIALQPLPILFGGSLPTGHQTGPIHLTVLTDTVGFMTRSPWRPPEQIPDDASPPFVDITLDVALTSDDAFGNTIATQTQLGLKLLGISSVDGDQLVVDQFGATEIGTLGIATAPSNMALRLETGTAVTAPRPLPMTLVSTFPAAAATDFPPGERIELNFTGPIDARTAVPGPSLLLSSNGSNIPITSAVDGSTLIVTPAQRLQDNASYSLTYGPINGVGGATGPSGALAFQTPIYSAASPAAPIVLSLIPGAPCALTGGSPGHCSGGGAGDSSYLPFTFEANRSISATFSQPMDPSTLTLGQSCGAGSVRIEALDGTGGCVGSVPGALRALDRGFLFTPNQPWKSGGSYRITLIGGRDSACDPGNICSRAGMPLNTAPLSAFAGAAGGPDLVIPFQGIAATIDSFQPLSGNPLADLNGNGLFDSDETFQDQNRVAMEISGTSGIISSASLNGDDCDPQRAGQQACAGLHAELPASVGQLLAHCPIDSNAQPTSSGGPCLEVRLWPSIILSTSLSMNTTAIGFLPINNLPTGALIMRTRETGAPQIGYIMSVAGESDPQFVVHQDLWVDAPDLSILGGLVSHDLRSKPLSFDLRGPVTFLDDGRMQVAVSNLQDVQMVVNVSALLSGSIQMLIAKGEMHITVKGPLLR